MTDITDGLPYPFTAKGNAMDDDSRKAICNGDTVYAKPIGIWECNHWIRSGKSFDCVIITQFIGQPYTRIRRIDRPSAADERIRCVATNPDKKAYPDVMLSFDEIQEMYLILKVLRTW